jgi:O-antigen/teichoic acid export membrane protein
LNYMAKRKSHKSIPIYFAGSILRQLIGFIMLPIYTSMLSPVAYGVIGLLSITVSIFETTMGARFAQSVPKFYWDEETPERKKAVISTALTLTSFVSLFSTAIVYVVSEPLSELIFGDAQYSEYLALYSVLLLTVGIESYGLTYLRIQDKAYFFVAVSAAKLAVQLMLNILFVVHLELGVAGVVYSAITSSSLFALMSAIYVYNKVGVRFCPVLTRKLFIFSWPLWVAGLSALYLSFANRYFIRIYADLSEVGLFELAVKFSMIATLLVWSPFSNWWQTERFKIYKESDNGRSTYPVVFNGISTALVFIALTISILSEPVINIMSAEAFHGASAGVTLLVIGRVAGSLSVFFFTAFLIKEKTIIITYLRYTFAILVTIGFVFAIPQYGFIGAALVIACAQACMLAFVYFYSKRFVDMGVLLGYPVKIIFMALLFMASDYFFVNYTQLIDEVVAKLSLLLLSFVSIYLLMITDNNAKILPAKFVSIFRRD